MADHLEHPVTITERIALSGRVWPLYNLAKIAGFVGIIGSVAIGYFIDPAFRRFYFAYLVSLMFFVSISIGALVFVLLQHLVRAGWSASVRRIAECLAACIPILGALSAPIILSVILHRGDLYRWAQPAPAHAAHDAAPSAHEERGVDVKSSGQESRAVDEAPAHRTSEPLAAHEQLTHEAHPSAKGVQPPDPLTLHKRPVLNRWFFTLRVVFYFAVWSLLALWYWQRSTEQDKTGDVELTTRMQGYSAPALVVLALSVTFASFDLIMSLDPHWFSTIFGIYFLAGSIIAGFATMIIVLMHLQRLGYLHASVNVEHYHDLGKWLFGFVFFWGYIAFSQFMLIWYGNIPEETGWLARRGATTARQDINGWSWVSIALLFGQLLIPFAGLMSRKAKRNKKVLAFWAMWLLAFHWLDLYWMIVPELDGRVYFPFIEFLCFMGIGGIFMATSLRFMAKNPLRPLNDPRLEEALAFQNV